MERSSHQYDDIIGLPHHVSGKRAGMSRTDRGAQFSPFAALTGFDAAIEETARLTESRVELSESEQEILNEKIRRIQEDLPRQPEIALTFFRPDSRKQGGAYVRVTGRVKKIDLYCRMVRLTDGTGIPLDEIIQIDIP